MHNVVTHGIRITPIRSQLGNILTQSDHAQGNTLINHDTRKHQYTEDKVTQTCYIKRNTECLRLNIYNGIDTV